MPKAKRKQLNIGITPDQYEAVRIAAEEEEQTITVYLPSGDHGEGSAGAGDPRRDGIADVVDSLLAIHQQGEDTARIAECLAGLLCSWIGLTISAGSIARLTSTPFSCFQNRWTCGL